MIDKIAALLICLMTFTTCAFGFTLPRNGFKIEKIEIDAPPRISAQGFEMMKSGHPDPPVKCPPYNEFHEGSLKLCPASAIDRGELKEAEYKTKVFPECPGSYEYRRDHYYVEYYHPRYPKIWLYCVTKYELQKE